MSKGEIHYNKNGKLMCAYCYNNRHKGTGVNAQCCWCKLMRDIEAREEKE